MPYNDPTNFDGNTSSNPRGRQAGADGQVRGYGMGRGSASHQQAAAPQGYEGYAQQPQHGAVPQGQGQQVQPGQYSQQHADYGMAGMPVQQHQQQPIYGQPVQGAQGMGAGMPQQGGQAGMQNPYPVNPYATRSVVPQQEEKKKKRGVGFWIGIIVAILLLILAGVMIYMLVFAPQQSNRDGALGQLDGKTSEEIQAELDRVVDEGMFNISIASMVEFENGTAPGEFRIENVPGNRYLMQVSITRDDNGQQIYQTGVLEPNHHIQSDELDVALPAGTYPCTAHFYALDPENEEVIGEAAANITINVLN